MPRDPAFTDERRWRAFLFWYYVPPMFSEDVVLGGLKAGPSWFISDHILRMDAQSGKPEDVAMLIADRNDLRCERVEVDGKLGFRFWRIE